MMFQSKVALVTGAGGGIGLAAAQAFAREGATVVLADMNAQHVQAQADEIIRMGGKALALACDVTDEKNVRSMIESSVERFGKLDFAFNNAGIHVAVANTAQVKTEDFDKLMNVNLRGVFLCMKYELQQMQGQSRGSIVNCSSQSGLMGIPGLSAYTASKHAVIGLTKAAALEYAKQGIRINVVCPGTTETPMVKGLMASEPGRLDKVIADIPIGRMARPEEIASAVLWLCSPLASFTIGQSIVVDGGYSII
jgi:NAD(P)-dependent dehydrogenase (short-subunit alcohol dehydrogenase family)